MLERLFLNLMEVSLFSIALISLLVLTSKLTTQRYSSRWKFWAWLLLAVRLLVPYNFSAPAAVSFPIPQRDILIHTQRPQLTGSQDTTVPITVSVQTFEISQTQVFMLVWIVGICLF